MKGPKHFKVEIRVTEELYDAIEAAVESESRRIGLPINRSVFLRSLILRALSDNVGQPIECNDGDDVEP